MEEIFKPIKRYELLYEISNLGRIKSLAKKWSNGYKDETFLSLKPSKSGYVTVRLNKDGIKESFSLHFLVASHFIENPNNLKEVNHKDHIRHNNVFGNLQWVTHADNIRYGYLDGFVTGARGEKSPVAKLSNEKVLEIRSLYKSGKYTQQDLANLFNQKRNNIAKIINNKRWTHI